MPGEGSFTIEDVREKLVGRDFHKDYIHQVGKSFNVIFNKWEKVRESAAGVGPKVGRPVLQVQDSP